MAGAAGGMRYSCVTIVSRPDGTGLPIFLFQNAIIIENSNNC